MIKNDQDKIAAQLQAPMDQQPQKTVVREGGKAIAPPLSKSIEGGAFVAQRDTYRQRTCGKKDGQIIDLGQVKPGRAPFARNDLAEDVVDVPAAQVLRKLEDMEAQNLQSAQLKESPWSSTYWPIYQGELGARYADGDFPAT